MIKLLSISLIFASSLAFAASPPKNDSARAPATADPKILVGAAGTFSCNKYYKQAGTAQKSAQAINDWDLKEVVENSCDPSRSFSMTPSSIHISTVSGDSTTIDYLVCCTIKK